MKIAFLSSSKILLAGFSTNNVNAWLPGVIGPVPRPLLIRVIIKLNLYYTIPLGMSMIICKKISIFADADKFL